MAKLGNGQSGSRVYPPSLCDWQLLGVVIIVTEIALLLMMLGHLGWPGWAGFSYSTAYAQLLALASAGIICVSGAWLRRLEPAAAWIGSWLLALLASFGIAYLVGIVGTVLNLGPQNVTLGRFIFVSVAAVGLVSAALLRHFYIHAQWGKQVEAQADARVQALQSRIRPHFLFNSLNTIASLIAEDQEAAERATEDLADLFRGSMQRADRPIPLREEIDLARKYLAMEQRRLEERMEVDWKMDDLPGDALVLPLTLQPLLENSVVHGVQPERSCSRISVFGRSADGEIMITIQNPAPSDEVSTGGQGMALANLQERLQLAYGDRASLLTRREADVFYTVLRFPNDAHTDR